MALVAFTDLSDNFDQRIWILAFQNRDGFDKTAISQVYES